MSITVEFDMTSPAAVAASLRDVVAQAKAANPTIADLRRIARTIDSPDDAPSALICRAAHATRDHLGAAPIEASLRALRWSDVDVREAVAAVRAAVRGAVGEGAAE